jgi:hypothetical protein
MTDPCDLPTLTVLKPIFVADTLPALGPKPRPERMPMAELNHRLGTILNRSPLSTEAQALIRSMALLWHDHLDSSHALSQEIESADGSFLHGIMHRREPDYGNAKYWFGHVGAHPGFPEIARRAGILLDSSDPDGLKHQLLPDGCWDAFAMVDAVERAAPSRNLLLQKIQRIEFEVLLERFCAQR